jgi:hypothetical protein
MGEVSSFGIKGLIKAVHVHKDSEYLPGARSQSRSQLSIRATVRRMRVRRRELEPPWAGDAAASRDHQHGHVDNREVYVAPNCLAGAFYLTTNRSGSSGTYFAQ